MSIHVFSQKIRELMGDNKRYRIPNTEQNSIVATGIRGKKPHILKIEDYNEDKLIGLVENHNFKKLFIDYNFWNYKYCKPEHLQTENLTHLSSVKKPIFQQDIFYVGMITVYIMYYSVIYNSLTVENNNLFQIYLSQINIDRNDFSRFLINNKIYFPLTKNYLSLIKRVFLDSNIDQYVFGTSFYEPEEIKQILSQFKINDIRLYSKEISEMDTSLENKYKLFLIIFKLYEDNIDEYQKVFISKSMDIKPVGYYLQSLQPTSDLYNLYQCVVRKYSSLDGAETIEVI